MSKVELKFTISVEAQGERHLLSPSVFSLLMASLLLSTTEMI
jgi:hypothetical protein